MLLNTFCHLEAVQFYGLPVHPFHCDGIAFDPQNFRMFQLCFRADKFLGIGLLLLPVNRPNLPQDSPDLCMAYGGIAQHIDRICRRPVHCLRCDIGDNVLEKRAEPRPRGNTKELVQRIEVVAIRCLHQASRDRHLTIERDQCPRVPALRAGTFLPVLFPECIVNMPERRGDELAGHLPHIRMELLLALNNIAVGL